MLIDYDIIFYLILSLLLLNTLLFYFLERNYKLASLTRFSEETLLWKLFSSFSLTILLFVLYNNLLKGFSAYNLSNNSINFYLSTLKSSAISLSYFDYSNIILSTSSYELYNIY